MSRDDKVRIRELRGAASDGETAANILRRAFAPVAEQFGLTKENCPRSPAFATQQRVEEDIEKGMRYYFLEEEEQVCGCVALEDARPGVVYLGRLAVLPEYRSKGHGKALVQYVFARARVLGADRVEIGIIAEDVQLRSWYERFGFERTGTRVFDHLPFLVGFLAKEL